MDELVVFRHCLASKSKPAISQDNNLLRLKRISQSFEDLTSETLYSKWKKARKNSQEKSDRRERSLSLILPPDEEFDGGGTGGKSLAATLQREIFRPRARHSLCPGELYRYRSKTVIPEEAVDINGNHEVQPITDNSEGTALQAKSRSWTMCIGDLPRYDETERALNASPDISRDGRSDRSFSPTERSTSSPSSEDLDDDVFLPFTSKPKPPDTIESKKYKIIEEIMSGTPSNTLRKVKSFSGSSRRHSDVGSLRCRLISDPGLNSYTRSRCQQWGREPRETEFLRTAEYVQRYLDNNKMAHEDVWKKRRSSDSAVEGRHKRIPRRSEVNNNAANIQDAASLVFPNDRSQPDASKRYVSSSSYGLIRQPEPQMTQSNSEDFIDRLTRERPDQTSIFFTRTMSVPSQGFDRKELRSSEEKEKDDRTVKFKDVDGSDMKAASHGVRRAQTLPRMPKRPLTSLTAKNWKESELKTRKGAEDLIQNINNGNDKSAQERVDIVEKAFEWIRKEVADLRAQDKDIMRMFTKIQAGIRHIKFDQSTLLESEEEFISTPNLSEDQTTESHVVTVHRRASLL